ncbi:coiled-coil domain-containing protein 106-like [Sander lucioperca]|uniref:coiled-coil domain-containing protein 106-like n=1 Tax=Sander lucioperca TaxID=283035 RepID=UPI00125D4917|nr:coiled-coil domain-containing protein 106-like [Sander lucioperca]
MPSTRRGKRAKRFPSSIDADSIGGSAEVEELHNVEKTEMLQEAGVETPRTSSSSRQKITALEDERNFLREQLKKALDKAPTAAGKHQSPSGSDSSDSYSSDSESSSSSSDRRKRKKKTKRKSIKKDKGAQFGKRMTTPEDVQHRYMAVLKTFQKTRSVNRNCEKHNVDRNTIAYTAVIAEVCLAADSKEKARVPPFPGGSLLKYGKELKLFLDREPALKAKI